MPVKVKCQIDVEKVIRFHRCLGGLVRMDDIMDSLRVAEKNRAFSLGFPTMLHRCQPLGSKRSPFVSEKKRDECFQNSHRGN